MFGDVPAPVQRFLQQQPVKVHGRPFSVCSSAFAALGVHFNKECDGEAHFRRILKKFEEGRESLLLARDASANFKGPRTVQLVFGAFLSIIRWGGDVSSVWFRQHHFDTLDGILRDVCFDALCWEKCNMDCHLRAVAGAFTGIPASESIIHAA